MTHLQLFKIRTGRRCLCAALMLCSLALVGEPNKEKDLQAVQAEIKELKVWLESAKGQKSKLESQLMRNEKNLSDLSQKIQNAEKALNQEESRLKKLKRQGAHLNSQLLEYETRLAKQLELAYRWRPTGFLKMALSADSPAVAARKMRYLSYLNEARIADIEAYRATLTDVRALETEVNQSVTSIRTEKLQLEAHRQKARTQKSQRADVLAKLKQTIANKDQALQQRETQRKRLEALVAKVERVLEQYPHPDQTQSFTQRKGLLPIPTNGQLVQGYDQGLPHEGRGWLIRGHEGTPVKAIHHGRIVFSDWLRGYGMLVIIDHGQGYMTLYARNQSLLKTEGEWVSAGEAIATMGRSGGYDTPSLYFEIRHKGKPVNPRRWMASK